MTFEYDPDKDRINLEKHGIALSDFNGFDSDPLVILDNRSDYGEIRFRAFGKIDGVPHCLVFTERNRGLRLISFRRAHEKEVRRYESIRSKRR